MNLTTLHKKLDQHQRLALATAMGIKPEYLAHLASGFKRNPSLVMCAAMVAHDKRLTLKELAAEFVARAEQRL